MASTSPDRSPPTPDSVQPPPDTAPAPDSLSEHLSFPAPSVPAPPTPSSSTSAQPRTILKDRLYVGNLHSSVDEYTLLQVFSKYGKIAKLDFLFHKSGPLKGKPRGYAFVEYSSKDDADKALARANDKLLRGRKLVVTYANQAPLDLASGVGAKSRRMMSEAGKPTTLSLLKSAGGGRSSDATDTKIARMEAKLRQLEHTGASTSTAGPSSSTGSPAISTLGPGHPSLPPKPVAATAALTLPSQSAPHAPTNAHATGSSSASGAAGPRNRARAPPLPALPIAPPTLPSMAEKLMLSASAPARPSVTRAAASKKSALSGVRIVKTKNAGSAG